MVLVSNFYKNKCAELPHPITIAVVARTKSVDDSNKEQIQLEDITEKNSNKGELTTEYVARDTTEININSYTD